MSNALIFIVVVFIIEGSGNFTTLNKNNLFGELRRNSNDKQLGCVIPLYGLLSGLSDHIISKDIGAMSFVWAAILHQVALELQPYTQPRTLFTEVCLGCPQFSSIDGLYNFELITTRQNLQILIINDLFHYLLIKKLL